MNLQIQCPTCDRRFTVPEDLSGKTVECSSCGHFFLISSATIVKERHGPFSKDRNEDDFFGRLSRIPAHPDAGVGKPKGGEEEPLPQVDDIMPASPAQGIAAAAGAGLLILYSLFFLIGSGKGGVFQDMVMVKRVVLASFVGVLGFSLIIYGAKNWRVGGVALGLILAGGLGALTMMRPVLVTPDVLEERFKPVEPRPSIQESAMTNDLVKIRVGYSAVERKIRTFENDYGDDAAGMVLAIFVENLSTSQFYNLEKYFSREFSIPKDEAINRYPRNRDADSLLVISGVKIDFEEAVRKCEPRLGQVETYPELRLIDLKLSATHSSEVSTDLREMLSDPRNRSFFAMNLKELSALNFSRVKDAVKSLAMVPDDLKLQYEEEILIEFMRLLREEEDLELLGNLAKAFRRWAPENPACLAVASQQVDLWIKEEKAVAPDFLVYLIENKEPRALALIDQLWSMEPELWSNQYALLGMTAEPRLIEHLESSPMRLKKGAAGLLASVGTAQAMPELNNHLNAPDEELRILVERAIRAIESR